LKIANELEPPELIDLQNAMLSTLDGAGLRVSFPTPIPAADGSLTVEISDADATYIARLLSFVPGRPLDEVHAQTPGLETELGRLVASVDDALSSLEDPPPRGIVWDPRGAVGLIRAHLDAVGDTADRELVGRVLDSAERDVAPIAERLPIRLIHNDAHGDNVRVDPGSFDCPARITGLVDCGDAVETWAIAGLATACAYAGFDRPDPVQTFVNIARGYASVHQPGEAEANVLFSLIRLRLALSVTVSAVRAAQDPANSYLTTSAGGAWELLRVLDGTSDRLARYRLRSALGLDPVPGCGRVAAALSAASDVAGPLLEPDPRAVPTLMIDLSVGSGDDGGTFDPTDHTQFNRLIFDRMRDAGAEIGIGRYDEVRWWYTTDEFIAPGNEVDEWRSVHIGLDLFAPAGTPVRTPLAGRVVSVRNNDDRLDYGPTVVVEHELPAPNGDDPGAREPSTVRFRTLYGHLSGRTLEETAEGQDVQAGDIIAWLGAPPENGDWAPHLHFQIIVDPLDYVGTFPGVAAPSQRDVWLALSPDPNLLLSIPSETTAVRPRSMADVEAERNRRLGPSLSLSYRNHLHIVRGRGSRLYDVEGQPYLDCVNNVTHVGHAHPRLTEVARRQMGTLNTNTRYLHETILAYTDALTSRFPDPLSVCFLVCSGTEANELALRMARTHAGKTGAVVVDGAYHGNSSSVVNLSPYKFDGPGGKGVRPWVRVVPMPDPFRGLYRGDGTGEEDTPDDVPETLGARYAAHVGTALASLNGDDGMYGNAKPLGAAAFFCESLLSCGGQIPLPSGYLAEAVERVRNAEALYVADEVQVGFGRVGSHFWAFEEHGVVPDIVTLGKPIGNGHPLAAVVTTPEIAASFANGMEYFNTYGGNPVSCAIGLEVLRIIEDEGLQENALRVGAHLEAGLRDLMTRHDSIGDVRGRGLFLGIEFVGHRGRRDPDAGTASKTVERMRDRGVLLSTDGPDHNVIKIKPPMVFSVADAELVVEGLDDVLSEAWVGR
ncbi:MAG: aminotransferase class III-fold pyridoxal phosphate-dependent enzyme, partial [Gemmatimonadota bacterium]|nr:aminotransferase class III-fold pyridoxal phosphate-dependent enzyme [Gemmatimonadota bacterium]